MSRLLTEQQRAVAEDLAVKAVAQERILLGVALENPHVALRIASDVQVDDFYNPGHQAIFNAIQSCVGRNRRPTITTIEDMLTRDGVLGDVGGVGYLQGLVQDSPSASSAPYALDRVLEASSKRQLLRAARIIASYAIDVTREDPLSDAIGALLDVNKRRAENHVRHIGVVMAAQVNAMQAANEAAKAGTPPLAETGFHDVDSRIILGPGKLVIVAARPGMGKSSFAWQAAMNVAKPKAGEKAKPVLLATMEMDGEELASRQIASEMRISTLDQARGRIHDDEWDTLWAMVGRYQGEDAPNLYVYDKPSSTIAEIEAAGMRLAAEHKTNLGMVVIDYLGLVDAEGRDETAKTAAISKACKQLARRLRCPVILLSQLNRQVEQRDNKRPMLSDLRQSGAIEQDADVVMFIYRDEYYNPESAKKGIAEVIIAKNRGGKANVIAELEWQGDATRFANIVAFPTFPGGDEEAEHAA